MKRDSQSRACIGRTGIISLSIQLYHLIIGPSTICIRLSENSVFVLIASFGSCYIINKEVGIIDDFVIEKIIEITDSGTRIPVRIQPQVWVQVPIVHR